jgi:hypothetical protein
MSKRKNSEEKDRTVKRQKKNQLPISDDPEKIIVVGLDECSRGPIFSRVYCAAVVFGKDIVIPDDIIIIDR